MHLYRNVRFAAYALTFMGVAITAKADIAGSAWLVPDNFGSGCAQNAVIGCVPGGTANATFTLTGNNGLTLGFNNGGLNDTGGANPAPDSTSIATLGAFINSNAAVAGGPAGVTYHNNASATTLLNTGGGAFVNYGNCINSGGNSCGTIFEFTGTTSVFVGENFTTFSDDGVSLYLGCTPGTCTAANAVLSNPGPEGATAHNSTYTSAEAAIDGTGNVNFVFVYAECCTLPATFTTNLASGGNVPEPTSIILLGTLMIGLGIVRRKYSA